MIIDALQIRHSVLNSVLMLVLLRYFWKKPCYIRFLFSRVNTLLSFLFFDLFLYNNKSLFSHPGIGKYIFASGSSSKQPCLIILACSFLLFFLLQLHALEFMPRIIVVLGIYGMPPAFTIEIKTALWIFARKLAVRVTRSWMHAHQNKLVCLSFVFGLSPNNARNSVSLIESLPVSFQNLFSRLSKQSGQMILLLTMLNVLFMGFMHFSHFSLVFIRLLAFFLTIRV